MTSYEYDNSQTHCFVQPVRLREFTASDGYTFRYRHFEPDSNPSAYLVGLHGIQSHSGWYEYSCEALGTRGIDVRFLDRRGSGQNEQQRGHAPHADRLINDVRQFLLHVAYERDRTRPDAPIILLGLSWGGRLAAACASRQGNLADALCLLYPGIESRIRPNWIQSRLLKMACESGKELRTIQIPLNDPKLFTSVETWQEYIASDSLALHDATLGFLHAGEEIVKEARRHAERITVPIYLALAGQDRIIDNEATLRWLNRVSSVYKVIANYPLAAHTLEFELERDQFIRDLAEWIDIIVARRSQQKTPVFRTQ